MTPMTTTSMITMIILTMPLMFKTINEKLAVKLALLASTISSALTIKYSTKLMSINTPFTYINPMDVTVTTTTNHYTTLFVPTALFVTWSIMEFSPWYLKKNKLTKNFTKYLLMFLIAMITLATAGNLFQLLIGWEGVGIMSFLLINWWFSRPYANSASLQAIIYNRIGDIGLVIAMATLAMQQSSWNIDQVTPMNVKTTLLSFGLMLAAVGKSAQFFMHMWLPAAMEGPTPVSALLHSSTMVVAGVYMLAQLHPMLDQSISSTTCLCLGATTSIYAATSALTQNDMKKVTAFSTSSQLGLMMLAIGMNCPNLAIFHMITHATFKAALFLAAGSTIHNLQNEQDIRKMGSTKSSLPITSVTLTTNGLTLSGMPFLSGFYSKDIIIETLFASNVNAWILLATMISTTMTSSYTTRMLMKSTMNFPNHKPTMMFSESHQNQSNPMIRLTLMTIIMGPTLTTLMLNSTHQTTQTITKMAPIMAILTGIYLASEFSHYSTKMNKKHTITSLINNLAYFKIMHRSIPNILLKSGYSMSHQLTDLVWLEKSGPETLNMINLHQSKMTTAQKGLMKNYLMAILLTMIMVLSSLTTF